MVAGDQSHPIRRIPNEILQNVFIQCSYADQNDEGYNIPNTRKAPLVLSYVCGSWRQLALHTSELWRRLHLNWIAHKRWSPSLLGQLWLSRCNSLPIHLSISEHEYGYMKFKNTGAHFALGYATQLLSLSLNQVQCFTVQAAPSRLDDLHFPLLQRLELRGWSTVLGFLVDNVRYPQLTRYRLDKLPPSKGFEESFSSIKSLSASITHLYIHEFYIKEKELGIVADMFPLLSTLGATVELEAESESQRQRKIVFTNLRRMKLTLTDGEDLVDEDGDPTTPPLVFDRLYLPKLVALETDYDGEPICDGNYHVAGAIYQFVQRSRCTLQELSISGWKYDDSLNGTRVLELASSIPTLRKLAYDGVLGSYGYCSQRLSIHCLHESTGDHPLIRVKGTEWEFLPLLEELHCHVDAEGSSLMGYEVEEKVLPEGISAIDRRMKSLSGRLKRCQVLVITRRPSGVSKVVADELVSLTKLGLTYTIKNLTLREENIPLLWSLPDSPGIIG